jgi:hypothetical protein
MELLCAQTESTCRGSFEIYSRPRLAEKIKHMTVSLNDVDYVFLLKVGRVHPSAASSTIVDTISHVLLFISLSTVIVSPKVIKVNFSLPGSLKKKS